MAPPEDDRPSRSDEDRILGEVRRLASKVERLEAKVDALAQPPRPREERVRTFVEGLDAALGGGIPSGHVVLVAGPAGAMKTSLALYMVHKNAAAGHPGVFVSLEESRESLLATMQSLGMEPRDDFIVDIARLRMEHATAEAARDWLAILKDFLGRRRGKQPTELVVIDPVNALYTLADIGRPRQEMFHFFNFLRSLGATAVLVEEAEGADLGARPEAYLADGILQLRFTNSETGRVALGIRVAKMRRADHARDWYGLDFRGGAFTARAPGA